MRYSAIFIYFALIQGTEYIDRSCSGTQMPEYKSSTHSLISKTYVQDLLSSVEEAYKINNGTITINESERDPKTESNACTYLTDRVLEESLKRIAMAYAKTATNTLVARLKFFTKQEQERCLCNILSQLHQMAFTTSVSSYALLCSENTANSTSNLAISIIRADFWSTTVELFKNCASIIYILECCKCAHIKYCSDTGVSISIFTKDPTFYQLIEAIQLENITLQVHSLSILEEPADTPNKEEALASEKLQIGQIGMLLRCISCEQLRIHTLHLTQMETLFFASGVLCSDEPEVIELYHTKQIFFYVPPPSFAKAVASSFQFLFTGHLYIDCQNNAALHLLNAFAPNTIEQVTLANIDIWNSACPSKALFMAETVAIYLAACANSALALDQAKKLLSGIKCYIFMVAFQSRICHMEGIDSLQVKNEHAMVRFFRSLLWESMNSFDVDAPESAHDARAYTYIKNEIQEAMNTDIHTPQNSSQEKVCFRIKRLAVYTSSSSVSPEQQLVSSEGCIYLQRRILCEEKGTIACAEVHHESSVTSAVCAPSDTSMIIECHAAKNSTIYTQYHIQRILVYI